MPSGGRYVIFRRSRSNSAGCQSYLVYTVQRRACSLETLVRVTGTRWSRWCIKSGFEAAKKETGLDGPVLSLPQMRASHCFTTCSTKRFWKDCICRGCW